MQTIIRLILVLILSFTVTGCDVTRITPGGEQKPTVLSLPLPSLPNWIAEISPTGDTETLAQIRIRFTDSLIPLESLDTPNQKQLLSKFEIIPPLPGKFRFLTPRMVGFEADKAIPKASRVQITLKAGLADLKKHKLEQDLAWTFNTEKIKITDLTKTDLDQGDQPLPLDSLLSFNSNVELDLVSLRENISLKPAGKKQTIPVEVYLKELKEIGYYESEQETFEPSQKQWVYNIKPKYKLKKATDYTLEISSGLRSLEGNLPGETSFASKFSTYSPLAFKELDFYGKPDSGGAYGRFVNGSPLLKFNNGLVAESAVNNISLSPPPKKVKKIIQVYEGEQVVQINPWALEPDTDYTITIGANLKDKFGQTLNKPITINYHTGDISPEIWSPTGLNIFPTDNNLQLNISTVNLPEFQYQSAYRVVEPTDLVYADSANSYNDKKSLLPPSNTWEKFTARGNKNQTYENSVPLREKLGKATGMLAYGVKAKTNTYLQDGKELWREPEFYGLVQLTNLGVFAQWFPNSGLIRVNHLSDGSAVKDAKVEVYKSQLDAEIRGNSQPCLVSKTDNTGTVVIGEEQVRQCFNNNPPELLVIAREKDDWAFTRTYEYSGSYEYGIYTGWDDGKPISKGIIFSDRQLYQPGEKAWFTGTAYYLKDGILQQDKNTVYDLTLVNSDGKETNLGSHTTSEYGTFSLELPLAKNLPLGYYSIKARSSEGVEIYGEFRVAEFKPPNFKVDLNVSQNYAFAEQKVSATVESKYLFGVPVEGGKAKYYVTRQPAYFTPKGWEKFSFGRQWFWPEERPEVPTDVLQSGEILLDNAGKNSQKIAVTKDLPYPMDYNVEVQVSDVSNLSVAQSKVFTALPDDRLIGLEHDFVATSGSSFPVQLIVTDAEGKAISGEKVRLELQEMEYSTVTTLREGSAIENHQIEYKTVGKTEITSADTPQTFNLTAPKSGSYRIRANFANGGGETTATDSQIWVSGRDIISWGDRYKNNRVEIKLDKDTYKPGEIATALIQSPYPDAELHFSVVRHNTLYSQLTKVKGSAPKIQFQVTQEMLPNAAVEAVLVRQGKPLKTIEPGSVENLVKIGFTPFNVSLEDKYLQAKVNANQEKIEPGNEQTIELALQDKQGKPIQGQFTVMVVNEAILQLTGYRPPDLVKTVYAAQDISTRLADNRPDVVTSTLASPLQKGWGFGGGFSSAAGDTRIRKNFQPTAYYNGSVETDEQGLARVTFSLPDDLTTWRVMAVATDGNLNFGSAEATFITTKPLVTNPILPQFVRLGDRFLGGVSITNTTEASGNLSLQGDVTDGLQFEEANTLKTEAKSGTNAYLFPIKATNTGEGKAQFYTQLNEQKDSFEVPLEVKDLTITESIVESGVTKDRVTIPLNVDKNVLPNMGGLKIDLASTLLPEITAPAEKVFAEDWLPFADSSADKLSIAANLKILGEKYPQILTNYNLDREANQALDQLEKLQQADGGFSYLPKESQSNPFVTIYVAESIAKAQNAGLRVNIEIVSRLKKHLNQLLANPTKDDWCTVNTCKNSLRLKSLIALAELGDKRQDFLRSIYDGKKDLVLVEQIKLARYLWQFPKWQQQAKSLTQEIQEIVYQTGRSAVVNKAQDWWWFNSSTSEQAEALQLSITANSQPEFIDKLLRGLLSLRRDGAWQNNYDNAQALTALVAYSQQQPTPPNYAATVELERHAIEKVRFQGYVNSSKQVNLPMSNLSKGRHNLTLSKSGEGQLHYLAEYNYRLKGNQPGQLNGLRVTRYVHPVNQKEVLREFSLYAPEEPLTLGLGQVFDLELEIIADHPVDHVVITDQLPAGLEAIDTSFQTSSNYFVPQESSWAVAYQQIYKDKIIAYSDRFSPGVYRLHYLVRSVTQGSFDWPGAEAHLQYAPEEFGRCASSIVEIK